MSTNAESSGAVLFLVYNRPETTSRVFAAIRKARPARLYVAGDGPRNGDLADRNRCGAVRTIATSADWPCEVRTLFRENNLGCGIAVSEGIDWFFENESEGIILEDDCLPDRTFFKFCGELLERYRDDSSVMMVSGDYYYGPHERRPGSYFFSRMPGTWGWATWRRAWKYNDRSMQLWPTLRATDWLLRVGDGHQDFRAFWTDVFDDAYAGRRDIWDYQWVFSYWAQNGLTILPTRNLVKYIGYGHGATHTKGRPGWLARVPTEVMSFPLVHPAAIDRDLMADRWMDLMVSGTRTGAYRRAMLRTPGLRPFLRYLRGQRA